MIVRCVKCHEDFVPERVFEIWDGDVQVQYFNCTVCRARYQVMTTDPEMRSLIARRNALLNELGIAQKRNWSSRTKQMIEQRLVKVKARQKKILPALQKRGEEILGRSDRDAGATGETRIPPESLQARERPDVFGDRQEKDRP